MELLVPGGDVDAIKAAILAVGGHPIADEDSSTHAIYCGLDKFNARNRAANISFDELQSIIRLAHTHNCLIFLTLNILILENEITALTSLLNQLANTQIDGLIVQDLGLLYLLKKHYPTLPVHASTQMTTHNPGQIKFLHKLGVERVNLSRELNLEEIKHLSSIANENKMSTEVFVHGSQCLSFSGICYMSSFYGSNSGNRGRCSQPCRDKYNTTLAGNDYPLNLKDNAAYNNIGELYDAGVYSLKIEGRIKKSDYIYSVARTYRKQLDSWLKQKTLQNDSASLYKVFNRDFSNAYLTGNISKKMFIDNPRDYSLKRIAAENKHLSQEEIADAEQALYNEKDTIKAEVEEKIKHLSIEKLPLTMRVSGREGTPLKVTVQKDQTSFDVYSNITLTGKGTEALRYDTIFKRLKAINDTDYFISDMDLEHMPNNLYLPFKELTTIKNQLLYILNDNKHPIAPIRLPALKNTSESHAQTPVHVIISSLKDLQQVKKTNAQLYFKLPSNFKKNFTELVGIFKQEPKLIPWFPAVIIGDDYLLALKFLDKAKPRLLVTDNTGIAFEACNNGIKWIAGPSLNLVNSYSLLCLKEDFNCSGAFLSNEISRSQIKGIQKPADFKLFYSIYHPQLLMTTRQCLFHQVVGCQKTTLNDSCMQHCEKSSSITNTKDIAFIIEKTYGNHQRIYGRQHCLNTAIVKDMPHRFDAFVVDLSPVKTETNVKTDHKDLLHCFEEFILGKTDAEELHQLIAPTSNNAYKKGI
ncbi:putative protease [Saccharicrinis carchari]|uniref:Putative protease n=2 Tax=Saccharicrinis carchari TaxID=1168039 RepID=A0A521B9J1_SACCC|nr:putative protease [Saccharicrinis carchari]